MDSVVVNQLDRQHHKPLVRRTVKVLVSCIEEFAKFTRICPGRIGFKQIRIIKHNPRLCRIRDNIPEGIQPCIFTVLFIFIVSIHHICNTRHDSLYHLRLAVNNAAQAYGVLAVLVVEHIENPGTVNRFYQNNIPIKPACLICNVDKVINKCT